MVASLDGGLMHDYRMCGSGAQNSGLEYLDWRAGVLRCGGQAELLAVEQNSWVRRPARLADRHFDSAVRVAEFTRQAHDANGHQMMLAVSPIGLHAPVVFTVLPALEHLV